MDQDDVLTSLDIVFDDLDNEFIFVSNNELDVYFFITKHYVNLVIKTNILQEDLNEIVKKYFSLPR